MAFGRGIPYANSSRPFVGVSYVRPASMRDDEAAVHDLLMELANNRTVSDPTYAKAYYNRGLVSAYLGDRQGAQEDLHAAAELFLQQGRDWDRERTLEKIQEL